MLLVLGRISCIISAGGYKTKFGAEEVLTGDLETKSLQKLPQEISFPSMVLHNGTVLLCGGNLNFRKCLQLDHGIWKEHSTLNKFRVCHSAVTTQSATFIFGGNHSKTTYEYLPKDYTTWLKGKNEIPGGFLDGCATAVKSEQEIWLIGGLETGKRILSFNTNDHTFHVLSTQLNVGRYGLRCAYIPNTSKVMITGGNAHSGVLNSFVDSTEILDTVDGSITMASPMNLKRCFHAMGVITINGEDKLTVFGGSDGRNVLDSTEVYNTQTENWETSDIKLNEPKECFGFLTVKLEDVISNLKATGKFRYNF